MLSSMKKVFSLVDQTNPGKWFNEPKIIQIVMGVQAKDLITSWTITEMVSQLIENESLFLKRL